jgi:hypothetical protein
VTWARLLGIDSRLLRDLSGALKTSLKSPIDFASASWFDDINVSERNEDIIDINIRESGDDIIAVHQMMTSSHRDTKTFLMELESISTSAQCPVTLIKSAESDGFASAYFFPGQFYDYRWPLVLAGHDSINTGATDIRAGAPNGSGGITKVRGDYRETMSTHWFHDHMLDYTAQNVYKGNAAMMNIYSAIDRGKEGFNCHYANAANPNLCLPSGTALDWGNRDYDVNLVFADKAWDSNGQLFFNIFNHICT